MTAGDIQTVIGEKPGDPLESQLVTPSGPAKGQKTNTCMGKAGEEGMISTGITTAAKAAAREAGLKKLDQTVAVLKAQHWTEEKKNRGASPRRRAWDYRRGS